MGYIEFIRRHWRFLCFGFVLAFFSSFGQTFFVALFSAEIRTAFALSHGGFGFIYSVSTLAAGVCLIWLGGRLDDIDLRLYAMAVTAGLIAACLAVGAVSSVAMLYLAIFALRLVGQGLMSHTAQTTMSRYFDADRGKALSVSALGFPAGQALFPVIVVAMIASLGWRETWLAFGAVIALVLAPAVLWLLKGHGARHRALMARVSAGQGVPEGAGETASPRQWSRAEVVRDVRFYLVMPAILGPGFLMTGVLFHQVHLVETKGWSLAWFAACFFAYGAIYLAAGLFAGPACDKGGATRLLPYYLIPLAAGLLVLAVFDHPAAALAFLSLSGFTNGVSRTIAGTMWAETYGVSHLGAIRALVAAIQVFGTAIAPVGMGWMLDAGVTMEAIALMGVLYIAVATALTLVRMRM